MLHRAVLARLALPALGLIDIVPAHATQFALVVPQPLGHKRLFARNALVHAPVWHKRREFPRRAVHTAGIVGRRVAPRAAEATLVRSDLRLCRAVRPRRALLALGFTCEKLVLAQRALGARGAAHRSRVLALETVVALGRRRLHATTREHDAKRVEGARLARGALGLVPGWGACLASFARGAYAAPSVTSVVAARTLKARVRVVCIGKVADAAWFTSAPKQTLAGLTLRVRLCQRACAEHAEHAEHYPQAEPGKPTPAHNACGTRRLIYSRACTGGGQDRQGTGAIYSLNHAQLNVTCAGTSPGALTRLHSYVRAELGVCSCAGAHGKRGAGKHRYASRSRGRRASGGSHAFQGAPPAACLGAASRGALARGSILTRVSADWRAALSRFTARSSAAAVSRSCSCTFVHSSRLCL